VREFAHGVLFEALSREAVRDAAAAVALDEVLRALVAVHHSQVSGVPDNLACTQNLTDALLLHTWSFQGPSFLSTERIPQSGGRARAEPPSLLLPLHVSLLYTHSLPPYCCPYTCPYSTLTPAGQGAPALTAARRGARRGSRSWRGKWRCYSTAWAPMAMLLEPWSPPRTSMTTRRTATRRRRRRSAPRRARPPPRAARKHSRPHARPPMLGEGRGESD
jgi:hypothetical protein